jgi:ABC-type amino acid transport substrate-binding protein
MSGRRIHERFPTTGKVAGGYAVTLLVGALALLAAAQAHAGALEAAKARGTLVVGVRKDFPPLGYLDANGKHAGFEVDLARYMARQLLGDEKKLLVTPVSAGNRITALLSGSADMLIAAMTATEDRATVLAFSDPYFLSGTLLLVPRNSPIRGLPDVKGKRVAVIEGSIQEGGVTPGYPEAIRVKFWTVSEAVAALRAGKVDAFAEDDVLVLALARQYSDLIAVGKPFRPHPYGVAMPKGDGELRIWVNEQLRKAKADGTYDALWNKYFGEAGTILLRP